MYMRMQEEQTRVIKSVYKPFLQAKSTRLENNPLSTVPCLLSETELVYLTGYTGKSTI